MKSETFHCFIIVTLLSFNHQEVDAQYLGNVTGIQVAGNSLILSVGPDTVVFKSCTDNILMVNYRPNGIEDPDTLVVANTSWPSTGGVVDTTGDPVRITTANYRVEIGRSPLRFHLYTNGSQGAGLLCEEPAAGGIQAGGVALSTSGGNFYGVQNRSQGSLTNSSGGSITSGSQGQAGGPFAWTTAGWGFLADVDGGSISIGGTSFVFFRPLSPKKRDLEFYLIVGSPKDIIKGLHQISGFPPLFPKFTYGFMNTEWGIDQTELYSDIQTYRKKSIPIDAYILDFDWMDWGSDNYGEFRWGPKFPDGQSGTIVDTLNQYNMNLIGIRKPRVHVYTVEGQYGIANGFFVDYVTDYFSGKQVGRLDFFNPAVRKWFWECFAITSNSYAKGITGYWNDEADEYGGNLMFMQMQRSEYEGQRAYNNKRVWSINRNFYTGAQRYAYGLWSGDIQTGFPAMADQRLFMLSSIALGVSWWGMDIGGFQNTPSPENYYRWIQFGAFVPVFRVHGSYNQEREPWYFGAEAESIATKYIRLRYRLMPYIYAAAWENHETGISIVRPLVFEYPGDPTVANISWEWMFGGSLLVSPVVQSAATQQMIYLPEGTWYDFNSGKLCNGSFLFNVPVTTVDIPVFVKGGSIIPESLPAQYVDDPAAQSAVVLSSYPGGTGTCVVYDDDGKTYDYENGVYRTTPISHDRNDQRTIITIGAPAGSYETPKRDWLGELNWVPLSPDSVVLDSELLTGRSADSITAYSIAGWAYDNASQRVLARFPDDKSSHTLIVYLSSASSKVPSYGGMAPREFRLEQNYPNPFNPSTTFKFSLAKSGRTSLKIYDALGRQVAEVFNGYADAGKWLSVSFDGSGLASGTYLARLESGANAAMRKILLVK